MSTPRNAPTCTRPDGVFESLMICGPPHFAATSSVQNIGMGKWDYPRDSSHPGNRPHLFVIHLLEDRMIAAEGDHLVRHAVFTGPGKDIAMINLERGLAIERRKQRVRGARLRRKILHQHDLFLGGGID